jgi:hypothetical protein
LTILASFAEHVLDMLNMSVFTLHFAPHEADKLFSDEDWSPSYARFLADTRNILPTRHNGENHMAVTASETVISSLVSEVDDLRTRLKTNDRTVRSQPPRIDHI